MVSIICRMTGGLPAAAPIYFSGMVFMEGKDPSAPKASVVAPGFCGIFGSDILFGRRRRQKFSRAKRIKTVFNFVAVFKPVAVGIGIQRIGMPYHHFVAVGKAVAVGVGLERIGVVNVNFLIIGKSVVIGIDRGVWIVLRRQGGRNRRGQNRFVSRRLDIHVDRNGGIDVGIRICVNRVCGQIDVRIDI